MRYLSKLLILFFILFFFTGCDFKDIDRRTFIVAVGIDSVGANGEIEVSFKAAIPKSVGGSGSQEGGKNFEFYTVKGNSLGETFRLLKTKMALEPDFGHMKIIVLGERYVKNNEIDDVIDFFARRRDIQLIGYVAVGSPSAKTVLNIEPQGEKTAGSALFMKFGQGTNSEYGLITMLKDVKYSATTKGMTVFCPVIEAAEGRVVLEKLALFDRFKFSMFLNRDETKLFKLLFEGVQNGYIVVDTLDSKNPLGINVNSGKGSIKLKEVNDDIICNIKVTIKGNLEEVGQYVELKEVEARAKKILDSRVNVLVKKLQEKGLDPLQLQVKYWANNRNYDFSDEWLENQYKKVQFKVDSNVVIERTGIFK